MQLLTLMIIKRQEKLIIYDSIVNFILFKGSKVEKNPESK